MEAYRSGHNGPDSKSGSLHGLVGSNPTASAKGNNTNTEDGSGFVLFLFCRDALLFRSFLTNVVLSHNRVFRHTSQIRCRLGIVYRAKTDYALSVVLSSQEAIQFCFDMPQLLDAGSIYLPAPNDQ